MRTHPNFLTTTLAMVIALSSSSRAQDAGAGMAQGGSVRADGDATGIALGDDSRSRLHLGADAGFGFDTNPYTTPLATGDFTGDVAARIRPYVEASMPGSMIDFRGRAAFDYGALPGVLTPSTRSFLLYQANVSADAEIRRGAPVSFVVGDTVSLHTDPGVVSLGSLLSRVNNQLRLGVGITPGGGSLKFRLGVTSTLVHFFADESADGFVLRDGLLDTLNNTAILRADYRFLPKTGAFVALTGGWQVYPFARRSLPQAFPVGVRLGLQGQVLAKLSTLLAVGYDNPLVFDENGLQTGQVAGLSGQAEAQWAPTPATALAIGYRRNFEPVALYQFLGQNRAYVRASQLLGVTELYGFLSWSLLEYGEESTGVAECGSGAAGQCDQLTDTPVGRVDHMVAATVRASYYVLPWLAIGLSNSLDWRVTNAGTVPTEGVDALNLSYLRNETLLLASVRY
ncbi:MAG: hypothetical protein FJ137_17420 [Deltaproteobacteria bacterium]|nr:hypothetical protein [Deltaproteobacteria bacterium]